MSEHRAELGQPLISHHMVVPAQCRLGRDGSDPAPCLGSTGELAGCGCKELTPMMWVQRDLAPMARV